MMVDYSELNAEISKSSQGRVSACGDGDVEQAAGDLLLAIRAMEPLMIWVSCPATTVVLSNRQPLRCVHEMATIYCAPRPDTMHVCVGNICFIDCNRMAQITSESIRVASILEELVHSLMHVHCESLVKHLVALIFPRVEFRNGRYVEAGRS